MYKENGIIAKVVIYIYKLGKKILLKLLLCLNGSCDLSDEVNISLILKTWFHDLGLWTMVEPEWTVWKDFEPFIA